MAFKSELQKLADSPIYPEEKNIDEDELELGTEDEGEDGFVYHSDDGIMMRNNVSAKEKIEKLRKKAKRKL
jgi:hypothetical protein